MFFLLLIGFNCGEAANIATPGWLSVARDAAIRRASINVAPMVSHTQLLYDLAVSISSMFDLYSLLDLLIIEAVVGPR